MWYLTNTASKYVFDVIVYQGTLKANPTKTNIRRGETTQGGNIVKELVDPLEGRGYVVVINNFFTLLSCLIIYYKRVRMLQGPSTQTV